MKISIDLGGTTYSFAIYLNTELNYKSESFDIKKFINHHQLLDELKDNVNKINNNKITSIGIACPGPLNSETGEILNTPNLRILQYVNLKEAVIEKFNCQNVSIENDANVFAFGSYKLLKCNINDVLLGITLGTGIGFGIVINGIIFKGSYGMAGEYEPSPLENNLTWSEKIGYKFFQYQSEINFSKNLTPKQLFQLAENNNEKAIEIWNNYGENIGLCLSHVINIINPNYISIGGGISKGNKFFDSKIRETLKDKCFIFDSKKINISYDEDCHSIYYGGLFLS